MPRFQPRFFDRSFSAKLVGVTAAVGLHIAVLAAVMMASKPKPEMPQLAGEYIQYVDLGVGAPAASESEDNEAEPDVLGVPEEPDESLDEVEPQLEPEPLPEPEPELTPEPEPIPEPEPV